MNGLLVLFLLIFVAALPVFLVYLWFRLARFPLPLPWFLFCLLSGAAAPFIALLLQNIFPNTLLVNALAEELGRLLMLLIFFKILNLMGKGIPPGTAVRAGTDIAGTPGAIPGVFSSNTAVWGAIAGLLAGLGFALIESATYGAANMGVTLLRAFTAAPLHGACGARVGAAAAVCRDHPFPALMRFLSAAAIHGMYNFMLLFHGIPTILAIFIAFSALGSSVLFIHGTLKAAKE
ncbi:hypothetical protein AGMMS49579_14460 [Spirochaetia bacterium]|nr:hypothetical protein AGMMS49579_14460 [Spirochaetia bacterium]